MFLLQLNLSEGLPLGAFGIFHHNNFAVDRQRWLESLQDLEQLRSLLYIKRTESFHISNSQLFIYSNYIYNYLQEGYEHKFIKHQQ